MEQGPSLYFALIVVQQFLSRVQGRLSTEAVLFPNLSFGPSRFTSSVNIELLLMQRRIAFHNNRLFRELFHLVQQPPVGGL